MSVSRGRKVLATPGPTILPDEVLAAMHRQPIDLYGSAMEEITQSCLADLKSVFGTDGSIYIYITNGHGAWEAALTNILSRGDRVLALESGLFATAWADLARALGIEVELLPGDPRRAVDPAALEERLRADREHRIKAILVVQVDTASSVVNDIPAIRAAIDKAGHPALFLVDAIASLATMPFMMDAWRIDVALGAAQKGLMLPPGIAFVAAGPRAKQARQAAGLATRFWDWVFRDGEENYMKHCGTAPEHLIFGLRAALDLLAEEGPAATFRRHQLLADAVREAVSAWSKDGSVEFNIIAPSERSNAVTTILTNGFDPLELQQWCEAVCGVSLGTGIGSFSGKGFRIAHMGHVNAPSILGVLGAIEAGLTALRIGKASGGVSAASALLGRSIGRG
jgi:alanine-glyoxylate transaminase/serine-glyoxylate transaminase/serine-pyruvate transaminase